MKKSPSAGHPPADRPTDTLVLPDSLRIFTVRETAGMLKVTESVVRKLVHEGTLRGSRVGVQIRIPAAAIEAFLGETACRGPDPRRDPRRRGKMAGEPAQAAGRPPPRDTTTG
jgi:excisionase family DNA binding protein